MESVKTTMRMAMDTANQAVAGRDMFAEKICPKRRSLGRTMAIKKVG
jgi:hypothetical protein